MPRGGNRREGEGVLCLIVEATDARGRGCLLEATGTRQGVLRGGNRHQVACMSGIKFHLYSIQLDSIKKVLLFF